MHVIDDRMLDIGMGPTEVISDDMMLRYVSYRFYWGMCMGIMPCTYGKIRNAIPRTGLFGLWCQPPSTAAVRGAAVSQDCYALS